MTNTPGPDVSNCNTSVMIIQRPYADGSVAALGASGVYTGSGFDTRNHRRVTGYAYSDQAGTLYIDYSDDNSTWRMLATGTAVAAATLVTYDVICYGRYARLRYVNGATLQTTFELRGYLCPC